MSKRTAGKKGRIRAVLRRRALPFCSGIVFAVLSFVGLNLAMAPVSKSSYCGGTCHEMGAAYRSWELSPHGANKYGVRAECIDCHLPPKDKYFRHVVAKGYEGAKDMYKHHFGDEYDPEGTRKRVLEAMPSERCLGCHSDLLGKPGSQAARTAHMASLGTPESHCVRCHEDAGHERTRKIFSP